MQRSELEKPYRDQATSNDRFEAEMAAALDDLWSDLRTPSEADRIIHRWVADERELLTQIVVKIAEAQSKDFTNRLHAFRKLADFIEAELTEEVNERSKKMMEGE